MKDDLKELDSINLDSQKEFDKILTKKFGNSYKGFSDKSKFEEVKRVPLDCISLNNILGGGIPVGRVLELYGDASSGKSSLASHIISSYQKLGKLCMYVDVEHALDTTYMSYCGVDLNNICIVSPNTGEEALEAIRVGMRLEDSNKQPVLNLVVLDSVAALVPAADMEEKKEIGTTMIGSLARLMSTSLKQLVTIAAEKNITIILLNQERGTNLTGYGAKSGTTGGKAVQYYSSIRLDLNRVEWIEKAKEKIGQVVSIQTTKNKTHTPFKKAEINFIFPTERHGRTIAGVDVFTDIINLALENDIIEQSGAWFKVPHKEAKVAGLDAVSNFYLENTEEYNKLKELVLEKLNNNNDNS